MAMILRPVSLTLNTVLNAEDVYLPLTTADHATLLNLISNDGDQIYLTITDDLQKEYVLATNNSGTIVLTRGIDSWQRKFPKGSCVYFENSIPVTKWLVCNHNCCDEECPIEPVVSAGFVLPQAKAGNAWEGSFVFSGDLPMTFGITGLPDWCESTYAGNYVKLHGVPSVTGTYTIAVSATNNRGQDIAVQQATISVGE